MTQYLLSVWGIAGEADPPADQIAQMYAAVDAFNAELQADKVWVFAGGLEAVDTATVVSVRDGDVITTDGPFAESKEQLGGFWIIEVPDLDTALGYAARASTACMSPVEVRPFQAE